MRKRRKRQVVEAVRIGLDDIWWYIFSLMGKGKTKNKEESFLWKPGKKPCNQKELKGPFSYL